MSDGETVLSWPDEYRPEASVFHAVNELKIDRTFVSGMEGRPQQAAIVRAIVGLARNLGMDVIAEGVETDAQADTLLRLRCPTAQGFLFSRPIPAAEAERLIVDGLPPRPAGR